MFEIVRVAVEKRALARTVTEIERDRGLVLILRDTALQAHVDVEAPLGAGYAGSPRGRPARRTATQFPPPSMSPDVSRSHLIGPERSMLPAERTLDRVLEDGQFRGRRPERRAAVGGEEPLAVRAVRRRADGRWARRVDDGRVLQPHADRDRAPGEPRREGHRCGPARRHVAVRPVLAVQAGAAERAGVAVHEPVLHLGVGRRAGLAAAAPAGRTSRRPRRRGASPSTSRTRRAGR